MEVSLSEWSLALDNPFPVAMGLASSTVDVCGVLAAVAALGGRSLSEESLFSLCCGIEPSDGVMFSGLALVDHLGGRLLERLPAPPPLFLVALLPRRTLETAAYRLESLFVKRVRGEKGRHQKAYEVFREGLLKSDVGLVAAGAGESAAIQQKILPRDEWPLLLACQKECGGLGVVVAHSGTVSAVIFASVREARLGHDWLRCRWDGGRVERFVPCGGGIRTLSG
jgi:L-threonine kinase